MLKYLVEGLFFLIDPKISWSSKLARFWLFGVFLGTLGFLGWSILDKVLILGWKGIAALVFSVITVWSLAKIIND
jgi:hypothetical protein